MLAAILCGVVVLCLRDLSSSNNDMQEKLANTVNQWIGKQLNLPSDIGFFTTNGDTLDTHFPREKFTVLRYIGKDGCTSCRMHLARYSDILSELVDSAKRNIGFVCIINPPDISETRRLLKRENTSNLTIWIDETDTLNRLNQFPETESLQTFLLDHNNRILAIGDPAVNPRIMRLYTQILGKDSINSAQSPHTQLLAENTEIDLGVVSLSDTVYHSVLIRNIGKSRFVLNKVLTSCDCTMATLSASSIPPGESATLFIQFSESETIGDFYRTISIFGNTDMELLIELYGKVV